MRKCPHDNFIIIQNGSSAEPRASASGVLVPAPLVAPTSLSRRSAAEAERAKAIGGPRRVHCPFVISPTSVQLGSNRSPAWVQSQSNPSQGPVKASPAKSNTFEKRIFLFFMNHLNPVALPLSLCVSTCAKIGVHSRQSSSAFHLCQFVAQNRRLKPKSNEFRPKLGGTDCQPVVVDNLPAPHSATSIQLSSVKLC